MRSQEESQGQHRVCAGLRLQPGKEVPGPLCCYFSYQMVVGMFALGSQNQCAQQPGAGPIASRWIGTLELGFLAT